MWPGMTGFVSFLSEMSLFPITFTINSRKWFSLENQNRTAKMQGNDFCSYSSSKSSSSDNEGNLPSTMVEIIDFKDLGSYTGIEFRTSYILLIKRSRKCHKLPIYLVCRPSLTLDPISWKVTG